MKDFAISLLPSFKVDIGKTRVSAITYSNTARNAFKFSDSNSQSLVNVQDRIRSIKYRGGSSSRLDKALDLATTHLLLPGAGARVNVKQVCFFCCFGL